MCHPVLGETTAGTSVTYSSYSSDPDFAASFEMGRLPSGTCRGVKPSWLGRMTRTRALPPMNRGWGRGGGGGLDCLPPLSRPVELGRKERKRDRDAVLASALASEACFPCV